MLATLDGVRAAGFAPVVIGAAGGTVGRSAGRPGDRIAAVYVPRRPEATFRKADSASNWPRCSAVGAGLLHANSLAMGRLSGPVAAELRLPSIGHLRDIIRFSTQAVADLNCHTRLLAVSDATRGLSRCRGPRAAKTHVLYNGVDLEEFHPGRPPAICTTSFGCRPIAR